MQTFLPFRSFQQSVSVLDNLRLNKQIVECFQIWNALVFGRGGWLKHPAVRMWRGHESSLLSYGWFCYDEWQKRWENKQRGGRRCHETGEILKQIFEESKDSLVWEAPDWTPYGLIHSSHRASLLAKNYDFYSQFGWREEPKVNYYWPV